MDVPPHDTWLEEAKLAITDRAPDISSARMRHALRKQASALFKDSLNLAVPNMSLGKQICAKWAAAFNAHQIDVNWLNALDMPAEDDDDALVQQANRKSTYASFIRSLIDIATEELAILEQAGTTDPDTIQTLKGVPDRIRFTLYMSFCGLHGPNLIIPTIQGIRWTTQLILNAAPAIQSVSSPRLFILITLNFVRLRPALIRSPSLSQNPTTTRQCSLRRTTAWPTASRPSLDLMRVKSIRSSSPYVTYLLPLRLGLLDKRGLARVEIWDERV
jgi:hypothetical protein